MNLEQLIDNLITGKDPYVYEIRDFIDQMDIIHTHASIRINTSSGLTVIGEYPLIGGNQVDIKVSYFKTVKTIIDKEEKTKIVGFLKTIMSKHSIC